MGKPTRHYGKWRIRWIDENEVRQSKVFDDKNTAALELQREELAAEERRRGLRAPPQERRTFSDAADFRRPSPTRNVGRSAPSPAMQAR